MAMKKIRIKTVFSLCAVLVLALMAAFVPKAIPAAAWGLSFPEEGGEPRADVSREKLEPFGAKYIGNTEEKELVLTFDAGYENGNTAAILDVLQKHQVPAAFFLVGNYLERNPELVRRMAEEGHTVGNHTYHHRDMSKVTEQTVFQEELTAVEDLYRNITGEELPKFYRPPEGCYSEENLRWAQEMGYRTVFWSLAYADWDNSNQPSREAALTKLNSRVHNGAVVLLHSTSKTNAEILDELLTGWEQAGYTFLTLEELFD